MPSKTRNWPRAHARVRESFLNRIVPRNGCVVVFPPFSPQMVFLGFFLRNLKNNKWILTFDVSMSIGGVLQEMARSRPQQETEARATSGRRCPVGRDLNRAFCWTVNCLYGLIASIREGQKKGEPGISIGKKLQKRKALPATVPHDIIWQIRQGRAERIRKSEASWTQELDCTTCR